MLPKEEGFCFGTGIYVRAQISIRTSRSNAVPLTLVRTCVAPEGLSLLLAGGMSAAATITTTYILKLVKQDPQGPKPVAIDCHPQEYLVKLHLPTEEYRFRGQTPVPVLCKHNFWHIRRKGASLRAKSKKSSSARAFLRIFKHTNADKQTCLCSEHMACDALFNVTNRRRANIGL